jgi:[CysO sulfur-carrier protein]-S-L-cysteine hydrolase
MLRIPQTIFEQIIARAIVGLPNECCGLLAGRISEDGASSEATAHYPLTNELQSPTEFLSDSREMLTAVKDMRQKGIDILAIYHSHPTSKPIPSKLDLERNYGSSVINLIIGLKDENPNVQAWWLNESSFDEARWELV